MKKSSILSIRIKVSSSLSDSSRIEFSEIIDCGRLSEKTEGVKAPWPPFDPFSKFWSHSRIVSRFGSHIWPLIPILEYLIFILFWSFFVIFFRIIRTRRFFALWIGHSNIRLPIYISVYIFDIEGVPFLSLMQKDSDSTFQGFNLKKFFK